MLAAPQGRRGAPLKAPRGPRASRPVMGTASRRRQGCEESSASVPVRPGAEGRRGGPLRCPAGAGLPPLHLIWGPEKRLPRSHPCAAPRGSARPLDLLCPFPVVVDVLHDLRPPPHESCPGESSLGVPSLYCVGHGRRAHLLYPVFPPALRLDPLAPGQLQEAGVKGAVALAGQRPHPSLHSQLSCVQGPQ